MAKEVQNVTGYAGPVNVAGDVLVDVDQARSASHIRCENLLVMMTLAEVSIEAVSSQPLPSPIVDKARLEACP